MGFAINYGSLNEKALLVLCLKGAIGAARKTGLWVNGVPFADVLEQVIRYVLGQARQEEQEMSWLAKKM